MILIKLLAFTIIIVLPLNSIFAQQTPDIVNEKSLKQDYFWDKERLSSYLNSTPTNNDDYEAIMQKGIDNMKFELYAEAIPYFRKSISLIQSLDIKSNVTNYSITTYKGNPYPYFYIALCKDMLSQTDSAIHYHNLALNEDDRFEEGLVEIGNIFIKEFNFREAKVSFHKVLNINPQSLKATYNLGYTYFVERKYKEAKSFLKKAITINSNFEMAYFLQANICIEENNRSKAISYLNKIISLNPNSIPAFYLKGQINLRSNLYNFALRDFSKAYSLDSNNYKILYMLGLIQLKIKSPKEGCQTIYKALLHEREEINYPATKNCILREIENLLTSFISSGFSKDEQKLGLEFIKSFFHENSNSSKEIALKYSRMFPKSITGKRVFSLAFCENYCPELEHNISIVFNTLNQSATAEEYYRKLIAIDSFYYPAYLYRSKYYLNQNKQDKALSDLHQFIKIKPYDREAFELLAKIYIDKKDYESAIKRYKKIESHKEHSKSTYAHLGYCYRKIENYYLAMGYQAMAIKNDSVYAFPYFEIGNCQIELGKFYEAIPYFKKAILLNPKFTNAYETLGENYFLVNDLKRCIYYSKKAIALDSTSHFALCNIAISELNLGEYETAKKYYQKAIDIDLKLENHIYTEAISKLQELIKNNILKDEAQYILDKILLIE